MRLSVRHFGTPLSIFFMLPIVAFAEYGSFERAEPTSPARSYRNPEERREAGLGTQVTDWLKFSGLIEIEQEYNNSRFSRNIETTESPTTATLQIGLDITPTEWLEAELIFEAEYHNRYRSIIDEAMIGIDLDSWGLKVGRQYLPFGTYYSHFATGPILEFGEIRKTSLIIDYSFSDAIEIAGFVFEGDIDKQGNQHEIDWGVSIEIVSEDESIRFGAGFLSDLTETNEPLLENENTFRRRVSGWNAYILIGFEEFEITAEAILATRTIEELESDSNKPSSYNIELAYFPTESLQFAARIEHSRELADKPEWQFGVASTRRFSNYFSISIDYLYGTYKNQFVFNDQDDDLEYSHQVSAQLVMEF